MASSSFLFRPFLIVAFLALAGCQAGAEKPTPTPILYTPPAPRQFTRATLEPPTPFAESTPHPTAAAPTFAPTATTPASAPTPTTEPPPSADPVITLLFTGSLVPARCVQAAVEAHGGADFLYDDVRELLGQADLTIGTLNTSLTAYAPSTGCVQTFVLVGSPDNAGAMARAGFDLLSVATNHIKNCGLTNCGDRAFFDTLENLTQAGILPVGAGKNLAEASAPVVVEVRGVRFVFLSLGEIEPLAFAGENTPGIGVLTGETLRAGIAQAREMGDVVIVLPHWGPEYTAIPNPDQRRLARVAVEAGADLVIGNHTHVIQAMEEIDGVVVFYGLGNFVFDQTWSRETQQGLVVRVTFQGKKYISSELIPVHIGRDGQPRVADQEEAVEVLLRIRAVNEALRP